METFNDEYRSKTFQELEEERAEIAKYIENAGKKRLRVCAYCRVSTDKSDQKNSLNSQVKYFQRELNQHPNWINVGIYSDEGKSGTSRNKRDDFNLMIERAKAGEIDLIITKELSRFSRNLMDTLSIIKELREKNVDIWFLANNLRAGRISDYQKICEHATRAQGESLMTSERVNWGHRQSMEMGVVYGRKEMFGYNIVKDEYGFQQFEIIEEEAKIVRDIFSWFAAGDGTSTISKRLEKMGVKTKRFKNGWSNTVILRLLRNSKYRGHLVQGLTHTPDPLTHKKKYNKDTSKYIVIENHHAPIVDEELWDAVQKKLKEKEPSEETKAKHSNRYWVSGKIFCGLCGDRYVSYRKKQKTVPYKAWVCINNHSRGRYKELIQDTGEKTYIGCNGLRVNERILKEALKDIVSGYLRQHRDRLINDINKKIKDLSQAQDRSKDIAKKEKEIAETKHKYSDLIFKYNEGKITEFAFTMTAPNYEQRIKALEEELILMSSNVADTQEITFLEWCKKTIDEILNLSYDELNEMLFERITKKIIVYPSNILEIHLTFLPVIYIQFKTKDKGTEYKVYNTFLDKDEFDELLKKAPKNEIHAPTE